MFLPVVESRFIGYPSSNNEFFGRYQVVVSVRVTEYLLARFNIRNWPTLLYEMWEHRIFLI